jgi:Domain of unknown function (DUF4226)
MVVERGAPEYGQAMAEQAGRSIGAIAESQAALSRRHGAAADADRALAEVLASAHAATVEGVRRLDAIAAEIDRAVANQTAIGLDTAIAAHEFQRFLIAKQREILAVVSGAHELDVAKKAALQKLAAHYTTSTG